MVHRTLSSLLSGSTVKIVGIVVLSLALLVGGAYGAGLIGTPELAEVDNRFGAVDESTTEIHTNLTIHNPNPVGIGFAAVTVDYVVSMNEVEMATGQSEEISATPGNSTERLTTRLDNERIPEWWASHVQNGEHTTVEIDATVHSARLGQRASVTQTESIETDLLTAFRSTERREVDANSPLLDDPILVVEETDANWGAVTDDRTDLELQFSIFNPKTYPLVASQIGYTITMNDVVVGEGATDREYVLQARQVTDVDTTTHIDNTRLDEWWVTHLQNDQVTDLRIEFEMQVELPAGQVVTVPLDELTYEETVETDVFGNKDESPGSADSTDGDDGTNDPDDEPGSNGDEDGTDDSTEASGSDDGESAGSGDDGTEGEDGGTDGDDGGTDDDDGGVGLPGTLTS